MNTLLKKKKLKIRILVIFTFLFFGASIEKAAAAISFVGSAVNSSSPTAVTTVTLPGGMQANDLIIVAAGVGDTVSNGMTLTTAGYTRVPGVAATLYANDTNDTNFDLYYKFHNGSDTTVAFNAIGGTNASNVAVVMVFRGVDTTTPFDVNATTVTGIDTSAANPPSNDHGNPSGVWTVIAASTGYAGTGTGTFTFPANYTTNAAQDTHDDTIDVLVGMGYRTSPADPEDPAAFSAANIGTAANNGWAAVTMALRPTQPQTLSQSAYRWFRNTDSLDLGSFTSDPTSTNDSISAIALDKETEIVYSVGLEGGADNKWRYERRNAKTSLLDYSIVSNPSSGNDEAHDLALDSSGLYLYAVGYEAISGNRGWRIEKRVARTGELVYATTSNPSLGNDEATSIALDESGNAMYISGSDSTDGDEGWRIEKRTLDTGNLVYAVTNNPSAQTENPEDVAIDSVNGHMYVVGMGATSPTDQMWRIEKRNLSNGSLVFASTTNYSVGSDIAKAVAVGTSSIYMVGRDSVPGNGQWRLEKRDLNGNLIYAATTNPSGGQDVINDIVLQNNETRLYIVGEESNAWRIEKRLTSDGSLVNAFGVNGVVTNNPSTGSDVANSVAFDNTDNRIYIAGYDSVTGNRQWRVERRDTTDGNFTWGNALAATNVSAVTPARRTAFRLRLLMHVANSSLSAGQSFKLQYAARSGTCDASFTGETYTDVSASNGDIRYLTNPGAVHGTTTMANFRDPVHGSDTVVLGSYVSDTAFTNPLQVPSAQDVLFDFSLQNYSATAGLGYCFRLVKSDGSLLNTYTVVPEIIAGASLATDSDQVFEYDQASALAPVFTIQSSTNAGGAITASNDLRIKINAGNAAIKWNTAISSISTGGTASSKVSSTVSFSDSHTAVVDVISDFAQGDTLTVSGLSLTDFTEVSASSSVFELYVDGASDDDADDVNNRRITIRGKLEVENHPAGQKQNRLDDNSDSLTAVELMNIRISPRGESATTTVLVVEILDSSGFSAENITNAKLVVDENSNGTIDGSELTTVGGGGVVSLPNSFGSITFSSPFLISTSTSLILQADISGIGSGEGLTLRVRPNNIDAIGKVSVNSLVPGGSTYVVSHGRRNVFRGGGGGGGNSGAGGENSGSGQQQGGGGAGGGGGEQGEGGPPQGGGGGGGGGGDTGWLDRTSHFAKGLNQNFNHLGILDILKLLFL